MLLLLACVVLAAQAICLAYTKIMLLLLCCWSSLLSSGVEGFFLAY